MGDADINDIGVMGENCTMRNKEVEIISLSTSFRKFGYKEEGRDTVDFREHANQGIVLLVCFLFFILFWFCFISRQT